MAKKSTKKAAKKKTTARKSAASTRKTAKSTTRKGTKSAKSTKKKSTTKKAASKKTTKKAAAKKKTTKKTVKKATPKKTAARKTTKKKSTTAKAVAAKKTTTSKRWKPAAKAAATPEAPPPAPVERKSRAKQPANQAPPVSVEDIAKSASRNRPLSPKDVEEFRLMLLQKRAEILGDVSALQGEGLQGNRQDASGDLSSMPIHMADLGSDNYELEFTLGLIEGERAILKEIDEALDRIREGKYGNCLATGNPIGKARLRATPWAKYCYEYTLAQERGQIPGA